MNPLTDNESVHVVDYDSREEWSEYIRIVGDKDIFYAPEYGHLYEKRGEGKACLFVYRNNGAMVCYPFLIRRIDFPQGLGELAPEGEWFDITTSYGYGGPLCNLAAGEDKDSLIAKFERRFGEFCRERRILTEFVRFHPLLDNHRNYPGVKPTNIRSTICVDLRVPEAALTSHYCSDHRRALRKINEHPVSFRQVDPLDRVDVFLRLYRETMGGLQANDYYYFNEEFCLESCRLLGDQVAMFEVLYEDEPICSATVWLHKPYMHGFLLGWDKQYKKLNPTKYLIHNIALWGLRNGYDFLHLGGGYAGNDDPLYHFKKGFGSNNEYDYYVGKKVHFPEIYDRMKERLANQAFDDFFPIYRHPHFDNVLYDSRKRDAI
ncbi:GNAT family N-acetyltransferase [Cohnella yongneupensis]|uniref:GNAT family N-acetyltransferase n=1 Tax=Cohnella yongneupensis TaxID=425006 RepID=A0ABW0R481_9BACL